MKVLFVVLTIFLVLLALGGGLVDVLTGGRIEFLSTHRRAYLKRARDWTVAHVPSPILFPFRVIGACVTFALLNISLVLTFTLVLSCIVLAAVLSAGLAVLVFVAGVIVLALMTGQAWYRTPRIEDGYSRGEVIIHNLLGRARVTLDIARSSTRGAEDAGEERLGSPEVSPRGSTTALPVRTARQGSFFLGNLNPPQAPTPPVRPSTPVASGDSIED